MSIDYDLYYFFDGLVALLREDGCHGGHTYGCDYSAEFDKLKIEDNGETYEILVTEKDITYKIVVSREEAAGGRKK